MKPLLTILLLVSAVVLSGCGREKTQFEICNYECTRIYTYSKQDGNIYKDCMNMCLPPTPTQDD